MSLVDKLKEIIASEEHVDGSNVNNDNNDMSNTSIDNGDSVNTDNDKRLEELRTELELLKTENSKLEEQIATQKTQIKNLAVNQGVHTPTDDELFSIFLK